MVQLRRNQGPSRSRYDLQRSAPAPFALIRGLDRVAHRAADLLEILAYEFLPGQRLDPRMLSVRLVAHLPELLLEPRVVTGLPLAEGLAAGREGQQLLAGVKAPAIASAEAAFDG